MNTSIILVMMPMVLACIVAIVLGYVYYKVEMEKLRQQRGQDKNKTV